MEIKDLIKPPFANYDVVVYFGCGLFSLPFALHYLPAPKLGNFLSLGLDTGVVFADTAVATLFLLFSVYIIGHFLAFGSSLFIEKTADLLLGKMSSACILAKERKQNNNSTAHIRAWVIERWKAAWRKGSRSRSFIRAIFLSPVAPSLLITFGIKWFGYFSSRMSPQLYDRLEARLKELKLPKPELHSEWYKAAEHHVINNDPAAVPRMYNYLVISGLFRSLAFLFAGCAFMELLRAFGGIYAFNTATGHKVGISLTRVVVFNALFAFSFASYIKFARRYAEEMLFAIALKTE